MANKEKTGSPKEPNIDKTFSAINDSVNLIDTLLAETDDMSEDKKKKIGRNVRHLELMLEKDFVKDSERSLTAIQKAITDANTFLTNNPLA